MVIKNRILDIYINLLVTYMAIIKIVNINKCITVIINAMKLLRIIE